MNLYDITSVKQRNDLIDADVVIENREYSVEEIKNIRDIITSHIFSKSKKDIGKETDKYIDFLRMMERKSE